MIGAANKFTRNCGHIGILVPLGNFKNAHCSFRILSYLLVVPPHTSSQGYLALLLGSHQVPICPARKNVLYHHPPWEIYYPSNDKETAKGGRKKRERTILHCHYSQRKTAVFVRKYDFLIKQCYFQAPRTTQPQIYLACRNFLL